MSRRALRRFAATPVICVAGLLFILLRLVEEQSHGWSEWFLDAYEQTVRWMNRRARR